MHLVNLVQLTYFWASLPARDLIFCQSLLSLNFTTMCQLYIAGYTYPLYPGNTR